MIIGLYGKKGVGKDFVCECFGPALTQYGPRAPSLTVARAAFADPIKGFLVDVLGLDQQKIYGNDHDKMSPTEYTWEQMPAFVMKTNQGKHGPMTIREIMQVFGTELNRNIWNRDIWVKALERRARNSKVDYFVITDTRFPNEVEAVKKWGGQVWVVSGPQRGDQKAKNDSHESENLKLDKSWFDCTISNEYIGSVEDARAGIRFQIAKQLGLVKI